jgi:propionyl-CoA carboxylase alpha chain
MEHALRAPFDGVVADVHVAVGTQVQLGAELAVITPDQADEIRAPEPRVRETRDET